MMADPTSRSWIIGYDIGETRQRQRACRVLRGLSPGYQKSVFEVVASPYEIDDLVVWLSELIEPHSDHLFIAARSFARSASQLGNGATAPKPSGFLTVT